MALPAPNSGTYFDQSKVDEVVDFFGCLTLTKCTKSLEPEPFEVLPHTYRIISGIYGPRRIDGRRRIRKAFLTFGRKQAKTQITAGICSYEFFMGEEPKQEIYFGATAADQAAKCYEAVFDMIVADNDLYAQCRITDSIRKIRNLVNGNVMQVLSADGKKQHGSNPSLVVFDEIHVWTAQHNELHSALSTGSKSRRQPLWITTTTAGTDDETIWGREYKYAKDVESGKIIDPSYLPIIYEVPIDADWTDKSLWHLALPLLESGHHKLEDYESDFAEALQRPDKQNEFRRLYLNQKTSSVTQWIPLPAWDACAVETPEEECKSLQVWGGLDLGSTNDFSAFSMAFKRYDGSIILRTMAWIPADTLAEREKRDGIPYQNWVDRGWMRTTPGRTINWDTVFEYVIEQRDKYDLQAVAFDRWKMEYLAKKFDDAGITAAAWGQGFKDMTPAITVFEGLVEGNRISHDGNRAMRWNMDCCQIESDKAGNKKLVKPPIKQKSKHIDMAVAAVMACAVSILIEGEPDPYANGGRLMAL